MKRNVLRVFVVAVLVAMGWVVGHAQNPATFSREADFELAVTTQGNRTILTCVRGCSLTWEPGVNANGQTEMHIPSDTTSCAAPSTNCRIWGWKR